MFQCFNGYFAKNESYLILDDCWGCEVSSPEKYKDDIEMQSTGLDEGSFEGSETSSLPIDIQELDQDLKTSYPFKSIVIDLESGQVTYQKETKEKVNDCSHALKASEPGVYQKILDLEEGGVIVLTSEDRDTDKDSEGLHDFLLNLKTHDSALKVLSNGAKLYGDTERADKFKLLRRGVKYIAGCKTMSEEDLTFNPRALTSSYKKRKECLNAYYTAYSFGSDTLEALLKTGELILPQNPVTEFASAAMPFISLPVSAFKLASKLSSFETALYNRVGAPDAKDLTTKNVGLIRAGVEASRELVKMGVLVAGATNPLVVTGLAVTGVATGCVGLYLNYNAVMKTES